MEGIGLLTSLFVPQNMALPFPHWFPGPTELGVPTLEFLGSIGLALHFHPASSFTVFLFLTEWKSVGHFPRAGPFPGFGEGQGIRLEGFLLIFSQGSGIQIGTICVVSLSYRARLEHGLQQLALRVELRCLSLAWFHSFPEWEAGGTACSVQELPAGGGML